MTAVIESALAGVDPELLDRDGRLELLERLVVAQAGLDALLQQTLACLDRDDTGPDQWVREEVAVALRIAPCTAGAKLSLASTLVDRLPNTWSLLADGTITFRHAAALVDAVSELDEVTAGLVESRVLARCHDKTVGQFRQHCRRAALALDLRGADARRTDAVANRSVTLRHFEHGIACLTAYLPGDRAALAMAHLDAHAGQLPDERTIDQKRADVLVDLLGGDAAGCDGSGVGPTVIATISTLTGRSDQPAELVGVGVVPAQLARDLAAHLDAVWRPVLTDSDGGYVSHSAQTYRPGRHLRTAVTLRDRTCRFPGCQRRADNGDLDHVVPFPNGPTTADNLHALCRRHHRLKHQAGWTVHRAADVTVWTTPAGRQHQTPAATYPVVDPPPF